MLIDQSDRDQALNPASSYIVQAPAGSGKTGLLVRRILRLLCVVEKPEEILAITFTRKATAEMRKRVIDALVKAHAGTEFDAHEKDMIPHAQAVLARDKEKQWQLLQQPQRLKIQTIDSLCAELVRKMPWSTRFGGMPQIETDQEALYTLAAQNLIEKIDNSALQSARPLELCCQTNCWSWCNTLNNTPAKKPFRYQMNSLTPCTMYHDKRT
jgi:ATP-dependent exoDNAse (exonuclease V) beta subunit